MKVIVIAAGSGKRLGKNMENIPKYLLDINGKTILEHQLAIFEKFNFEEIIVITGPHREKFTIRRGFTFVEDVNYQKHDILGSLMEARKHIKGDVLIIYSDIIFDALILRQIIESDVDIGIAVDLDWEKSYKYRTEHPKTEAENVLLDKNHNLLEIRKNITHKNKIIGEFLGILKLSKKGSELFVKRFEQLEKSHIGSFHMASSLEKAYLTDMLQELVDSKIKIMPIIISGKWCEIDTIQDLERAVKLFP